MRYQNSFGVLSRHGAGLLTLLAFLLMGMASAAAQTQASQTGVKHAVPMSSGDAPSLRIEGLSDVNGNRDNPRIALNGDLVVLLHNEVPLDPSGYVLFLNGHEIDGLDDAVYDPNRHDLVFHLQRNDRNAAAWQTILGAPRSLTVQVSVALGLKPAAEQHTMPTIFAKDGKEPVFTFVILTPLRVGFALGAIALMLFLLFGRGRKSKALKDDFIPQIDPARQTYSLGRSQMVVWFAVIFASYVVLWILLGDANTISSQALVLMGISGATALASVTIDATKDTPLRSVNEGLRLLGINSYDDVQRIQGDITNKKKTLAGSPPPDSARAAKLTTEIVDAEHTLRSYEDAIAPYTSEGWFSDMTTDINGTALHRIQVVCWTVLLSAVFVYGVWRNLAMPEFSGTLLALMRISGAGYVGFKLPESQA